MTNSPGTDPQSPSEIARDIVNDFRELRKDVLQLGGSHSSIKFDSGGMPMVVAGAAATICLSGIVTLILVFIWARGEVSDLKTELAALRNKDTIHDAYIQQHDGRLSTLEKTSRSQP